MPKSKNTGLFSTLVFQSLLKITNIMCYITRNVTSPLKIRQSLFWKPTDMMITRCIAMQQDNNVKISHEKTA